MINSAPFQNFNISTLFVSTTSKNLFSTILIVIALWIIYLVLRFFINRRCKNLKHRYAWRIRAFYSILFLSIYFIGKIWLSSISDLFAFLGIIAAALTLTQKETLMNMLGCTLIYWRELFHTGDRIQIGNYYGEVTAIRTFYFHMLECDPQKSGDQITGKIIKVPNGLVITLPITNFSELFPYAWHEFSLVIAPESDVEKTRAVLTQLIDSEVQHCYAECKQYLKKFVRNNFISMQQLKTQSFIRLHQNEPGGFLITVRYLALPTEQHAVESEVISKFLDYLQQNPIAKLAFA